jgi:hypothetical protein
MQIEKLQAEIEALPKEQFIRLRRWFADKDWELWDQQLVEDAAAGRPDFLLEEARSAKQQGVLKDL